MGTYDTNLREMILEFFNQASDPYDIVSRIDDDPNFGEPDGRGIGPSLAEQILNARTSLGGRFNSIQQIADVPDVGPDTLHDILYSFQKYAAPDEGVMPGELAVHTVATWKIAEGAVTETKLAADAVSTHKIGDLQVTEDKLADDVVTTEKIADAAVTTPKITDSAVTRSKLGDHAVTTDKIAANAVTTPKIADGQVTEAKLASNAVATPKIVNGAVTEAKLAANAITSSKIAYRQVTKGKLDRNAVDTNQLAAGAVTSEKIADGAVTESKLAPAIGEHLRGLEEGKVSKAGDDITGPLTVHGLAVKGKITAEEIEVISNVPDYVFSDNYELQSIDELEVYILENKHLPNIPSEKDVAGKGINLGQMQVKLLEKIEELTLYVIGLKKENDTLKLMLTGGVGQ